MTEARGMRPEEMPFDEPIEEPPAKPDRYAEPHPAERPGRPDDPKPSHRPKCGGSIAAEPGAADANHSGLVDSGVPGRADRDPLHRSSETSVPVLPRELA